MKTWPPSFRSGLFRRAARQLVAWQASGRVERRYRGCAFRAITARSMSTAGWVEVYAAKAFFCFLFRPANVKPNKPWWPKGDQDARVIALLLAELMAAEMNSDTEFLTTDCTDEYRIRNGIGAH